VSIAARHCSVTFPISHVLQSGAFPKVPRVATRLRHASTLFAVEHEQAIGERTERK
jgi:hypothetical protein